MFTEAAPGEAEDQDGVKTEDKIDMKQKATLKAKPSNAKAPSAKSSAPAKKANMTSKKGV